MRPLALDTLVSEADVVTLHVGARRSQDDGRRFYEIAGRVARFYPEFASRVWGLAA